MTFKKKNSIPVQSYQDWVRLRWNNKKKLKEKDYFVMTAGLGGETGEVLEILKKHVRDKKLDKEHLKEELGDVLYYLTMICNYHGLTLEEVIEENVRKIDIRYGDKENK